MDNDAQFINMHVDVFDMPYLDMLGFFACKKYK